MSDLCYSENLQDGDVLCWEMIKWAKEQGVRYFNMTGFDIDPKNSRQQGIRRFKSNWGGEFVHYGYYSEVYGLVRDSLVALAKKPMS